MAAVEVSLCTESPARCILLWCFNPLSFSATVPSTSSRLLLLEAKAELFSSIGTPSPVTRRLLCSALAVLLSSRCSLLVMLFPLIILLEEVLLLLLEVFRSSTLESLWPAPASSPLELNRLPPFIAENLSSGPALVRVRPELVAANINIGGLQK